MKNYFKALLYPIAIATLFAGITITGCTDVDDKLGLELLPDNQDMLFATHVMTDGGIDLYMGKGDFGYLKKLADGSTQDFEYEFIKENGKLPTHNLGIMRIGSMHTEGYGKIYCAFMGQFLPGGFELNDGSVAEDYYGPDASDKTTSNPGKDPYNNIDSVMLEMLISKILGKPEVEQKFYIYELTDLLDYKEAYYADTDPAKYIRFDKPLFSFTLKDETAGKTISKKLTIEPAGADFLHRLSNIQNLKKPDPDDGNKEKVPYENALLFRNEIKGFYIAPEKSTFEDAAIYEIKLIDGSYYLTTTTFNVCAQYFGKSFKNSTVKVAKKDENGNVVKDEKGNTIMVEEPKYKDTLLTAYYSFDDYTTSNTSVGIVKHDYAGSVVDESKFYNVNNEELNVPLDVTHVQGMLGVYTYMKFNQQFIDELKGLLKDKEGRVWNTMMVNQAKMRIWLDAPTVPNINLAPARLGMYYGLMGKVEFSFSALSGGDLISIDRWKNQTSQWRADTIQTFSPTFIPDYPYMYESSSSSIAYGGYLARSAGYGYYEMDISMLIMQLVNTPDDEMEKVNKGIWIGPAMTASAMFSPSQVALRNDPVTETNPAGATNPKDPAYNPDIKRIKVDLVYTLMKPKE